MKPLSEQTLYEILEIPDDAPPGEIQRAYERARALFAPGSLATYTLMAPEEAALLGRRIEEARHVLLDPVARAGYDARLASGTPMPRSGRTSDSTPTVTATVPPGFQQMEPASEVEPAGGSSRTTGGSGRDMVADGPPPSAPAVRAPPSPAAVPTPAATAPAPPAAPDPAILAPVPATVQAGIPTPPPLPSSPPFAAARDRAAPAADPAVEAAAAPAGSERPPTATQRPVEKAWFLPEGAQWSGEMLRRARESRGMTVPQLAERTKITRHHIENVEQDRFAQLPAPVYLRGIVMSMARELRLDGQKVARSYLEHMSGATKDPG
jgi:hypothetical protein